MRTRLIALAVAGFVLAAAEASAQTPAVEARAAFQQGVQQYAEQHYAEALESFRHAYRVRPHPTVLVNIANCYMGLGQPQQAITTFERYLSDPSTSPTPAQRTEIENALATARRQLASVQVLVQPSGAEVYLDGDMIGTSPLSRPLQTGPGPHVLEARVGNGASLQHQIRLEPGGTLTVTLDLVAHRAYVGSRPPGSNPEPVVTPPPPVVVTPPVVTPPPPVVVTPPPVVVAPPPVQNPGLPPVAPPPVEEPRRGLPGIFWGGLVVTLGAGGTAIAFAVYANNLADDYNSLVSQYNLSRDDATRTYYRNQALAYADAVDQNRLVAYIAAGVAATGAVVTIASAVLSGGSSRSSAPRRTWNVGPMLGHAQGLTLSGSF